MKNNPEELDKNKIYDLIVKTYFFQNALKIQ